MKRPITHAALCFGLLIAGVGCSGGDQNSDAGGNNDTAEQATAHEGMSNMGMEAGEPSEGSIYHLESRWQNRHGRPVSLDTLRGKIQVVAMVYTHCEHACPRILADMKRIRDNLSPRALERTHFTIVSIDPERDTPGRLTQFARENDLSGEQWTLLNGNEGNVLELAAVLGVRYKRVSETDFVHSNMITVLDQEGVITYQRKKLADSQQPVVEVIEKKATF
ncbi:MAG: SCO family protein [Balneolaceae bacterium]|nr:SCO family protein [Balneolaceae bacterium]